MNMNCRTCNIEKPIDRFKTSMRKDGSLRVHECKDCVNTKHRARRRAVPGRLEKMRDEARDWRANNPAEYLIRAAKTRAKKRCIPFDITAEDIFIPALCPVLNVKLEFAPEVHSPYSPSIDKFDPEKGYVRGNVYVISHRANSIKNRGTLEEIRKIVKWMESI